MGNFIINNLIIGVLASLLAAFVLSVAVKPIRNFFNVCFNVLIRKKQLGIKSILLSREKAYGKIYKDLIESKEVMILNFNGYSVLNTSNFIQTRFYELINQGRMSRIRFLILDPSAIDYRAKRRANLNEIIIGSATGSISDIKRNIDILKELNNDNKVDCYCRLFNEELKWSLIISDNFIALSFYPLNKIAHKSPSLIIKRNGTLFGDSFTNYFEDIWENHSKNAFLDKSKLKYIIITGGSFQGKSLIAQSLAKEYEFSGVLTTDMIRNFLKINEPEAKHLSTSTYKLEDSQFYKQTLDVSDILEKQLDIYMRRGEKMIIEGMHFSEEFIKKISDEKFVKIFLNNNKSLEQRVILKQKTRLQFSVEEELEYSSISTIEFEKTSYHSYQKRINEIHDNLRKICIENGFNEVAFDNLDEGIKKCKLLIEDYAL